MSDVTLQAIAVVAQASEALDALRKDLERDAEYAVKLDGARRSLAAENKVLRKQRDDLRDALAGMLAVWGHVKCDVVDRARAALERAR